MMRKKTPQLFAEFANADHALRAAEELRRRHLRLTSAYSPFEIPGLERYVHTSRPFMIPLLSLLAALGGMALAYSLIWWTAAFDYPLNVGGRPLNSFPADIPILFETGILCAAVCAFICVLFFSGLPRLEHELEEIPGFERTSIDRYWLGIAATGSLPDAELEALLTRVGALHVHRLDGGRT
ncbi:MAG TPA: DUF3341 domain-containing protein [Polyangiaceae bacterium]|nr:DUF3341 domain-containing protein [Polyangiaceae bacterium]